MFAPFGIVAAALRTFRERIPGTSITLIVLLLGDFAFGAAAGGKQNFVVAALAAVIPLGVARRRLPKAAFTAIIVVFLMVVVPFNRAFRAAVNQGPLTTSEGVSAAPGILRQTLSDSSLATALPHSLDLWQDGSVKSSPWPSSCSVHLIRSTSVALSS